MSRFQALKAMSAGAPSVERAYSRRTAGSRVLLLAHTKSRSPPGVSEGWPGEPVRQSFQALVPRSRSAPSSVLASAMVQSLV